MKIEYEKIDHIIAVMRNQGMKHSATVMDDYIDQLRTFIAELEAVVEEARDKLRICCDCGSNDYSDDSCLYCQTDAILEKVKEHPNAG